MKVAPAYRGVLKQLRTACRTHPHYVQDIRFLLSLPLHTSDNEAHTVVPFPAVSLPAAQSDHTTSDASVPEYLQRSGADCYSIDRDALFAMSYADLHSAVHDTAASASGSTINPVARQVLQYRNLLWLRERLARILSVKTQQLLSTSISISRGPREDDFIPDDAFAAGSETEGGDATEAAGTGAATATATAPSPGVGVLAAGGMTAETVDESDPEVVYSAGAIGLQQEMFVLRHREAFPMAAQFLAGFPTVTADELAGCAHQQAALTQLVRQKFPSTVTCQDAHVSLSVTAAPYDAEYTSKEHAGVGYFSAAHRQFRVQFSLEPLAPDGTGAERSEVLVVNSYFVRLDMELMQLVEEVGYLHSSDVLRMLRERDYGDHFSTFIGSGVAEVLGEGVLDSGEDSTSKSATTRAADATAPPTSADSDDARVFSLYFTNPTDAPMVLKGMLYYKLAKRRDLVQAPIRCIPFGFLLLEA